MSKSPRCLYDSYIESFVEKEKESIFGTLCDKYHGDALTTTREACIRGKILTDALYLSMIFLDWAKELMWFFCSRGLCSVWNSRWVKHPFWKKMLIRYWTTH